MQHRESVLSPSPAAVGAPLGGRAVVSRESREVRLAQDQRGAVIPGPTFERPTAPRPLRPEQGNVFGIGATLRQRAGSLLGHGNWKLAGGALALTVVAFSSGLWVGQQSMPTPGVVRPVALAPGSVSSPALAASAASDPISDASYGDDSGLATQAQPPEGVARQFAIFWEAWNFVEQQYYRRPVDRAKMIKGAIQGMLHALDDQHTTYVDAQSTKAEKASQDGISEGIGATVEVKDDHFVLIAPIEEGPAHQAGLRSGDALIRVNGQDTAGMSLAQVRALLKGDSGSRVRLTIRHGEDTPPAEVELTRSRIEMDAVTARMVADGIGYVRIRYFGTKTVPQLTKVLREMRAKRVRGLVLDLRENPGGYVSGAVDVASQFLKDGTVVAYEERNGVRQPLSARAASGTGGLATDLTLAVLVNRGSASAAEIVAGALRDAQRAVLIGEPTFGKGTMQQPYDLSDGSSLRVTVATWRTPSGKLIQGIGLTPTIEVKTTPEDEAAGRDLVLDKALEWFHVTPLAPTQAAEGAATTTADGATTTSDDGGDQAPTSPTPQDAPLQ